MKAFTEAPKVFGVGESGTAFNSMAWPGSNYMILAGMEEEQTKRVVNVLWDFRDRLAKQQRNAKMPLRVFALPYEQLI